MAAARPPLPVILGRYGRDWSSSASAKSQVGLRRAARRILNRGQPIPIEEGRDLTKQWRWSACYAPTTSLYLDQLGHVRACCQNTEHLLGDVRTQTLRQIWDGAAAVELRARLAADDLSHGCDFCAWQRVEAPAATQFAHLYDTHPAGLRRNPPWPDQLEFAVSNTCNLQCIMCNGDWSSAIRTQREHRSALTDPYPERFYDELVAFIPHLRDAKFAGGEPFLARQALRIMDLLAQHGALGLVMGVVTNGTIFNDRIERILHAVIPWISVSIDGGTSEVYERIRVGASFKPVLANIDRFSAIVEDRGAGMNLTHCLMTDNWTTFPEMLMLAEERALDLSINTVRFPEAHSLYHLSPDALAEVVVALDRRTDEVEKLITGSRLAVWHEQLGTLRSRTTATQWPDALGVPPEARSDPRSPSEVPVGMSPTRGARRADAS